MIGGTLDDPKQDIFSLFSVAICEWFRKHGRSFPWRQTRNPFLLIIAELLLRKTQADRVCPIYNIFADKYNSPEAVLAADRLKLEMLVEKLGLLKRVDWLVELSAQLTESNGDILLSDYKVLTRLKGVGPYTANMVLCLVFDQNAMPIDNNIARLISRFYGTKRVGDTRRERGIEKILNNLSTHCDSRTLTLGMLDFAAGICKPHRPNCPKCPLQARCHHYLDVARTQDVTAL